jgi:protein O-mannosyl-transferase
MDRAHPHPSANKITGLVQSPWFLGLLLFAATVLAYQPAWHAGYIWDDDLYVTRNPLLTASDGLSRIWFTMDSLSQYFPLTYTVFRLEHALWGLNPAGYHWVNILLHATNALLLWRLLKRLVIPGAWLAAAIFALHPVNVEAVAWVSELKSVLSFFFILLALLAWVEFIEEKSTRSWPWYGLAVIFYALALFAKTTACALPAAMLLILWLKKKPINGLRLAQTLLFLVMGVGMALVSVWWERYHIGAQGRMFSLGFTERILVASHAVWFYLGKLLWPVNLTFSYPKWTLHPADPLAWGWLAACAGLGVTIGFVRRFTGRSTEVAMFFYVAMLSPLLGFVITYTFRYSYVADHYQYVAAIGPITLAAAGMTLLLRNASQSLKLALSAGLLLLLGVLTWRQCGIYADAETLWRATIQRNPDCWLACNNLGGLLLEQGRTDDALVYIRKSLAILPDNAEARVDLGNALSQKGELDEAIAQFQMALAIQPDYAGADLNIGNVLVQEGRIAEARGYYRKAVQLKPGYVEAHSNLANCLVQSGQIAEAIEHYESAVELDPDYLPAQNNLAEILATCPDASLRNGPLAVKAAESANQLAGGANPIMLGTLASAYAEVGRFPDAINTAQRALQLATVQSKDALVAALQMQLGCYKRGVPFRDRNLANKIATPGHP